MLKERATSMKTCPRCRNEVPADAPMGLCPFCLLRGAPDEPATPPGSPEPLGDEEPATPPGSSEPFGDYEILEELGDGGDGVVHKARQVSVNRFVALKRMRDAELAGAPARRRFLENARAAARLADPHIVTIH